MNGNVSGKFCRKSVDLVELGVNSIPKRNNVLCLGVIPKGTKSEKKYKITWDDFRAAAVLMASYKDYGKAAVNAARGLCNCSAIKMSKNIWTAVSSSKESIPLRQQ